MSAKRKKLHEISIQDDIKYRGPLNYQHFQMLGWLCIVLMVALLMMKLGSRLDAGLAARTEGLRSILEYVAAMSLPFLLIANFSKILNNAEGYKKQLIRNGGIALGIAVIGSALFSRYVVGSAGQLVTDPENVLPLFTDVFRSANQNGFIAFNLFIDLFLCTLFMFFLNAQPKRVFTGKKVLILRVLALVPIAIEVASWILKWRSARGMIELPFWTFPLLTVKPPMTFAVFVLLALHMKTRELRFCRHGRTHEEYLAFLQTNRNSLHFSIYLAVLLVIAGILDLIILMILMRNTAGSMDALVSSIETTEDMMALMQPAVAVGFGEAISLIFVAPLVLLYSYTKMPKNKMISMIIPAVGIVLIILILLESFYRGLGYLPFERHSIQEIMQEISMFAGSI